MNLILCPNWKKLLKHPVIMFDIYWLNSYYMQATLCANTTHIYEVDTLKIYFKWNWNFTWDEIEA